LMSRECATEDSKASAHAEAFFVDAPDAGESKPHVELLVHGRFQRYPIWVQSNPIWV